MRHRRDGTGVAAHSGQRSGISCHALWRGARAERRTAAGRSRGGCVPAGYELKSISGFAYRGRIPDPQGGRLLFGARTRSGAAAQPRYRPCDCNRAARAGVSVDYGQSRVARAGPRPFAGCGAAAERYRADRHTGRAVCRLGGRRRPALHLSPHALDGADARPFMHPDCVQTGFAAGPD